MYRILITLVATLAITLPTAGCSKAANDGSPADSSSEDVGLNTPPIHVVQTTLLLKNGVSPVEHMYRDTLKACRQASMPTTALSEDVAGKLGRTFWDISYAGERMAVKTDSWDYATDPSSACRFMPQHKARLWIVAGDKSTAIDLISGKAESEETGPMRESPASDDPGSSSQDNTTYMGQHCVRRSDTLAEQCVWSGGRQWGFATDYVGVGTTDVRGDHIVLWNKPANGDGIELTTQSMSVGAPIDGKAFEVPSGIATRKAN